MGTTDHGCVLLKLGAEFSTVVLEITEECFKKQHSEHLNGFGAVLNWGSGNLNATF